jgi:Zn-dependent protease
MILRFYDNPTVLIISAVVMIMALIFHNIVQAWVASRYGDHSPKLNGFMNFDPQQHLEPFGVLFLFLLGFGWPKSITVNSRNYRGRGKQEALVWYSGPAAYLLVGFVSLLVGSIFLSMGNGELFQAFLASASFATLHAIINIFPVFPLDGARAALALGNPEVKRFVQQLASFGLLGFLVFFLVLNFLGVISSLQNIFLRLFLSIIDLLPGL